MKEIGFFSFLLGERWKPGNNIFGIFPMIMGSIYVTAGAIVIGVPIGILTSIFMAEYCPKKNIPVFKISYGTAGRNPICRVWLLRSCGACPSDPRHVPGRKRKQ